MITIEVKGLQELERQLLAMGDKAVKVLRNAGREALAPVLEDMKAHAGFDDASAGEHMRDTIKIRSTSRMNDDKYLTVTVSYTHLASFCPYNIGPAKCFPSTFYKKLNAGDRIGACAEIKRWIFDGGRDCRIKANNCAGQPVRRGQESELTCWDIDK